MKDMPKKFEELELKDDFMFGIVMRKPEYCKPFLETILGVSIQKIEYLENQKTIKLTPEAKAVRLDIYLNDENGTIYNIEMQTTNKAEIPKRSRYYQAMTDLNLLEKGQTYFDLPRSFVIFVCTFDYYNEGRHMYWFENRCIQQTELPFNDDTVKIVLNTKGTMNDVKKELKELLEYLDTGNINNEFTKKLDDEVIKVRKNERWRRDYMVLNLAFEEKMRQGLEQGLEQGREQGLEQGLEQGREQGLEQGREEGRNDLKEAIFLLKSGKKVDDLIEKEFSEETIKMAEEIVLAFSKE